MGRLSAGWVEVPIGLLQKADWNYKKDDEEKANKLAKNIERNGQLENILIRETAAGDLEVVNGNHRLAAFQQLKFEKVMCFHLGRISNARAKRIAIETNETRFETDFLKLAQLLKDMVVGEEAEFELADLEATMPFTHEELEHHFKLLDFDWNQFQNGGEVERPNSDKDKDIICPECGCVIRKES